LNSTILNSEIFPSHYQVFRCDRSDGYGGIFFACDSTLSCTQIPLSTTLEAGACKIKLRDNKSLIVLTVYRPPNRDFMYMHRLSQLMADLCSKHRDSISWITGDFNLPNIDCK